jgi:hypothetical protein
MFDAHDFRTKEWMFDEGDTSIGRDGYFLLTNTALYTKSIETFSMMWMHTAFVVRRIFEFI